MKQYGVPLVSILLSGVMAAIGLLAGGGPVQARGADATSRPFIDIATITEGAPLNFYNPKGMGGRWGGLLTIMPLAILRVSSNVNDFRPALASRWTVSKNGKTVTVFLNPKDKWSNGKALTAKDVVVSAQIGFIRQAVQYYGLGSVKAVGSHEVVFKQLPNNNYNLFERQVLELNVAPAFQYGQFVPANISQMIADSEYTGTDPTLTAQAKSVIAQFAAISQKIDAYLPPENISSGPYKIQAASPSEIELVKNRNFYDASKIRVERVILRNDQDDNQTIWNYLLGGQVYQATSGGMTPDLVNNIKHVKGMHFYTAASTASLDLVFNESVAPYNNVKVRQALAYVIDRKPIWRVAAATAGTPSKYIAQTVDSNVKAYLTKAQLAELNPYKKNLKTATKLLESAGLKKVNGKWTLPDGSTWTMNLVTVSGFNDVVEAFQNISSQLQSFGINAQPQLVPDYGQYLKDLGAQKYPVGFYIGVGLLPYAFNARWYGQANGWYVENNNLVHYTGATDPNKNNWMNFPTTVKVKGYGNVNVGKLTYELSQTRNQTKIKKIVRELMLTTNEYVPMIKMWDVVQTGFVNDRYFSDYPLGHMDVLRSCEGNYPPLGCWELFGYVKPK